MTTKEKSEIMLAHAAGAEVLSRPYGASEWNYTENPEWDWIYFDYRLKPRKPRRIWVDEYSNGTSVVHSSQKTTSGLAKTTEFVEVIKP
jgi:hypothetical protein